MKNLKHHVAMLACTAAVFTLSTAAQAATAEETCQSKRLQAWSKYEYCVDKVMTGLYAGAPLDDAAQAKLAKCRTKAQSAWEKLSALVGSTTCSGKPRFSDTSGATVTDNLSNLMWNKQGDIGNNWDKDDIYPWSTGSPYKADGTAFDDFLHATNHYPYDDQVDWRLPTVAELLSLVPAGPMPCATSPCIDPKFNFACTIGCTQFSICSCTVAFPYWTGVTVADSTNMAWAVNFGNGELFAGFKTLSRNVRAVRGGLR
jgi:hypothetical protein